MNFAIFSEDKDEEGEDESDSDGHGPSKREAMLKEEQKRDRKPREEGKSPETKS